MKVQKIAVALIAIALLASVAQNVRAQSIRDTAQDFFEAKEVCKRHRAELMKIPHVRVVTGEIDQQNEAAILVEVDDPKNVDSVMREVPSQIEGFPVEVDEGQGDNDDNSGWVNNVHAGHWSNVDPTPTPPTIDKNGYYHHTWLKPSEPAPPPDAQQ
jgi:hypothetical protein